MTLAPPGLRPPGRRINYHVDVEAIDNDTLFFAGTPEMLDLRARTLYRSETGARTGGAPLAAGPPLRRVEPVGGSAGAGARALSRADSAAGLAHALICNCRRSTRGSRNWRAASRRGRATIWRVRAPSSATCARTSATRSNCRISETADPLAYFLFTRRKGHCEYFASAMAVMLRSLEIPARMATGFQSGVYNPVSDLWLVRASDAHSWVEAWIPGRGWTTFDPTPPDPNPPGFALLTRLTLYLDAAETFWQQWVVDYDLSRQGALAYRMEQGAHRMGINGFDTLLGCARLGIDT